MKETLYRIVIVFFVGMLVMILHELPKSILYCVRGLREWKNQPDFKSRVKSTGLDILKFWKYIDPIGVLFCVSTYAGFSKPYMYRMKDKTINRCAGFLGFITLVCIAGGTIMILRGNYDRLYLGIERVSEASQYEIVSFYFLYYTAVVSVNMFLMNLIPISTFNLGLLIAGFTPKRYFSMIKNDHYFKMVALLLAVFGVIDMIGSFIVEVLLTL